MRNTKPWDELTESSKRMYLEDTAAYELLKQASKGRTYGQTKRIIEKMLHQLEWWKNTEPCEIAPWPISQYGERISPPTAGTVDGDSANIHD